MRDFHQGEELRRYFPIDVWSNCTISNICIVVFDFVQMPNVICDADGKEGSSSPSAIKKTSSEVTRASPVIAMLQLNTRSRLRIYARHRARQHNAATLVRLAD